MPRLICKDEQDTIKKMERKIEKQNENTINPEIPKGGRRRRDPAGRYC